MITNHEMRMEIRKLAKYMLDLTIKIEKMEKQLDSLSLTQKHLRESNPVIKQLDSLEPRTCPTCYGSGKVVRWFAEYAMDVTETCWRCGGMGSLKS